MEQLDVVDSINNAGNWLVRNRAAAELRREYRCGDCHHHRRDDRGAYCIECGQPGDGSATH